MSRILYPKDYVDSTYVIDFAKLYEMGCRGVIFDVDNTLVPHGAPADERAKAFFRELNDLGFKAVLLSNNKEPRVQSFKEDVIYCEYIFKASKPSPKGYRKAMEIMGTDVNSTVFVGDQLLTDIWGANKSGINSILVKPVKKWDEEIQIILKRFIEAVILLGFNIYKKKKGSAFVAPVKEIGE